MTFLQIGKEYYGFRLVEEINIKEINSIGRVFYHERSGARLFYIENDDDNKVFSVTFRTPPTDNTGLPHILEHAVLCGSKKFPLKDPFIELAKGSLNTYLNAMTFSDKTMYPIASQNEKDFRNLMEVYLDAVFYPNIYKGPETFMQEGWHYELNHIYDDLSYKGVVYNEMKGAFSSPEQILFRKIEESLFPDTIYRFESGGDPDFITDLTYEQFLQFHKKYYHPSNSYIYLYGDCNLMENLEFIHKEYLNHFSKEDIESEIQLQTPFDEEREIIERYSISQEESEENKSFLSLNYVVGKSTDPEKVLAFSILNYILLGNVASPLKKKLIEAELGKDVFGYFDHSILQPIFTVIVKGSELCKKESFKQIVNNTLRELVIQGIDKKLIEAAINIHEFKLREADYGHRPKGLVYNIKAMNSWLYDEKPWLHLTYDQYLNNINEALTTNYFEKLIEENLLNNCHCSLVILQGEKGLAQEKEKENSRKLLDYQQQLSEEEKLNIVKLTKALQQYQQMPEDPESLMTIPILNKGDINEKIKPLPLKELYKDEYTILYHPTFTNGITYISFVFDGRVLPEPLIPYGALLGSLIGKISTKKYHYEELANMINIHTGGIYAKTDVYPNIKGEGFYPKFIIKGSALTHQLSALYELLKEITTNLCLDELKKIKEIIQEIRSRLEMTIFDQGHMMAAKRVSSYFCTMGTYIEMISGISYYQFIADLDENFDQNSHEIINNLKEAANYLFNRKNLIVSITAEGKEELTLKKSIQKLVEYIPKLNLKEQQYNFILEAKNEGLLTSGKVQYVAKGYNFREIGYEYSGHLQVLQTIISLDYLWNQVRVAGGAYGCIAYFTRNGNAVFSSYRDPNLEKTLEAYDGISEYIEGFKADEREMRKYIIGTISGIDVPLSPAMKGERAVSYYISNITLEDLQNERRTILNTTVDDIRRLSSLVREIVEKDHIVVLGNENKIRNAEGLFNNLVKVFK